MFQLLISSATAGIGGSIGRDLYRGAKKNPVIMGIVGALLLAFGWRNLFMGYGRGMAYFIFVTIIGSALMILFGAAIVAAVAAVASGIAGHDDTPSKVLCAIVAISFISMIGIIWGKSARKALIRRIEVEMLNLGFLHESGFTESEFESDQMVDPEGHTLKVIEQTDDKIVFSVVGRRGLRAAIKLEDGEMVSYTGVQKAA